MSLTCHSTAVTNLTDTTRFFGFIPPHGKELGVDETYYITGSIWSRLRSTRARDALIWALENGKLSIDSLPTGNCGGS